MTSDSNNYEWINKIRILSVIGVIILHSIHTVEILNANKVFESI